MKNLKISALFLLMGSFAINAQTLKSPDGKFEMNFQLKSGVPYYHLKYQGRTVVEDSKLGLRLNRDGDIQFASEIERKDQKGKDLNNGFEKTSEKFDSKNESWSPIMGEKKSYVNHYNELAVTLNQPENDRYMVVKFRLFNDGLGFRYEFPEQKNLNYFIIKEEDTEIDLPADMKTWWIPGDYDSQEYLYTESKISEIPAKWPTSYDGNASQNLIKNGIQIPTIMKWEGKNPLYYSISEAAVINYPTANVEVDAVNFKLKTHLTPDAQGAKGYMQTSMVSPWRTIIISPKAEEVLDSKMIFNLNEPTKYKDTSYIKPTKYMGVWWEMIIGKSQWAYSTANNVHIGKTDFSKLTPNGKHAANNTKVKEYIDFASANGFDALLIEGWNTGWEDWFGHSKEFVFDFITP